MGNRVTKSWDKEQDDALRLAVKEPGYTHYNYAVSVGRSEESIKSRVRFLKITVGSYSLWADEMKETLISMSKDGKTAEEIANVLGLTRNKVYQKSIALNCRVKLTRNKRRTKKEKADDARMIVKKTQERIKCMCCAESFLSPDKTRIRLCKKCKNENSWVTENILFIV